MENPSEKFKGPSGTSGGVAEFLIGFGMALAGAYMITQRVTVGGGWHLWGYISFGLSLVP